VGPVTTLFKKQIHQSAFSHKKASVGACFTLFILIVDTLMESEQPSQ